MQRIEPEEWKPVGVDQLESAAWQALRSERNLAVVAGPGAGKTEFLAQKATYLLQTGLCSDPFRILAISFKKDAATNLSERVKKRCPPQQAKRFASVTFDAFTKSLIDRFQTALPEAWKPSFPYNIVFPSRHDYADSLKRSRDSSSISQTRSEIAAILPITFESKNLGSTKIRIDDYNPTSGVELAVARWWEEYLRFSNPSQLSFTMLNRLAELLLRYRPDILFAIRRTYPFVFVDEFQDTTYAQYDFLATLFHDSQAKITVVGDDKQKIMGWAGAMGNAFQVFESDYAAERIPLLYNFRSSPGLVQVQHVIARAMDQDIEEAIAQSTVEIDGDVAQIWAFQSQEAEITQLSKWVAEDMATRGKKPRDYGVLVRQKAGDFEEELFETFSENGLLVRNEAKMIGEIGLQDLIGEDLTRIFCAMIRVLATERDPASWKIIAEAYLATQGTDSESDAAVRRCENKLEDFVRRKKVELGLLNIDRTAATALCADILGFFGREGFARTFSHYSQGNLLEIVINAVTEFFGDCAAVSENWAECIDTFEGADSIPLMTIHKSKGLEFDTIVFIGLDDSSWWSYSASNPEGMATFFVALSRAKQRAIFTYCSSRGRRRKVSDLYDLLTESGVREFSY